MSGLLQNRTNVTALFDPEETLARALRSNGAKDDLG